MLVGYAIFLISAGVLGYEILLMRLLSVIQWYHFAYMIISLALLGFGASGTFIALAQRWLIPRFHLSFMINAVLFGFTTVGSFIIAQEIPFNPLEILWDRGQLLYLLVLYLLLSVPFFCAATCIGLTFARFKDQINRIYRFDLLGAGTGALAIILILFAFPPATCLELLGTLGFFAAGLVSLNQALPRSRGIAVALFSCGLILPFTWPDVWLTPRISDYKGVSLALRVPDAEVLGQHSSPLGLLTVVRSSNIPFRHAPGLSLNYFSEPPPQLGIFTDGDSLSPITRYDGKREPLAYLDYLSSALPYHLLEKPKVLVLGAGGGTDVLMALYHQAKNIDAVELNPHIIDLIERVHAEFAGNLYQREDVKVHAAEARGFVAGSSERYDLIQISLLDSFSASASGGYALNETYLYTLEALKEYLHHLQPGGLLAITRWLKMPPRDGLKLFATAVTALEKSGIDNPGQQLVLIRSWKTTTLLVKNGRFTEEEIRAVGMFCEARSFDVAYYPGIRAMEANRYNVLEKPYLYEGATALIGENRNDFLKRYKFYITPATDDRPYFFHFFKWGTLPEIFSLKGKGGLPLLEWTYPILIVTFLLAVVTSFVLILLPLWTLRRNGSSRRNRSRIAFYFLSLGLAFLFIEIAFIQKFILFLSHPLYAVAVVLCAFLVFAGLGSGYSSQWTHRSQKFGQKKEGITIVLIVIGIAAIAFSYMILLPPLFHRWMPLPDVLKIPISIVLIAPLAFCMGMPFPLGLSRVAAAMPGFIPWAWGVNGCASVLSAILATMLAIHFGFTVVIGIALILYFSAALALWRPLGVTT
ncbi:MAG: class I SAM-dependent methyltransferase [Desulfobacterales bacterium]|nr:class I SAM-dependent methyltransferase [Desulfobacterales bacterium]